MSDDLIETIRAHANNALSVHPQSVDARDKMFLIAEIDRLRRLEDAVCTKYAAWMVGMTHETTTSKALRECLEAMGNE